jgi:glyoxylase-like metal-dependent hydrolase (beta-lactamase superfamily II)
VEVEQIRPGLWHWSLPHPEWDPDESEEEGGGWDEVVSSYALVADQCLVLFDPLAPPAGTEDAKRFWHALDTDVEHHGPPVILLTAYGHARSSQEILRRYDDARLCAHELQADRIAERTAYTETFQIHDVLPGHVIAHDGDRGGEVIFWLPRQRALVVGDVLLGGADGVRLCPPSWQRVAPREQLVEILQPLFHREIDLLLLTHGGPVAEDPGGALERALQG